MSYIDSDDVITDVIALRVAVPEKQEECDNLVKLIDEVANNFNVSVDCLFKSSDDVSVAEANFRAASAALKAAKEKYEEQKTAHRAAKQEYDEQMTKICDMVRTLSSNPTL
jgi:hypothetical protein